MASLQTLFAQDGPPNLLDMFTSEAMQRLQKGAAEDMYGALWKGTGTNMMMFYMMSEIPDYRDAIGITPEQFQQIRDLNMAGMSSPEFTAAIAETQKFETPDDPFLLKADEATIAAYVDAQLKVGKIMNGQISASMEVVTTPEQKQRMREIQIACMDMYPIPNPPMFEALDLTDEQKSQMKVIQSEMETEFKQAMADLNDAQCKAMNGLYMQMKEDGVVFTNMDERHERVVEAAEKLNKKLGKDFRFVEQEKFDRAQDFVKQFKFRMFDVLTDAQMEKMSQLINSPPEYMSKIVEKMKKGRERQEKDGGFQPGPQSWKPGDPIPEDYVEHRKAKFPKKK